MASVGYSNHWATYQLSLMPDLHRLRHLAGAAGTDEWHVPIA